MITTFLNRSALRRWRRTAQAARQEKLSALKRQAADAMKLRNQLNEVIFTAENRLALPAIGSNAFPKPKNTDWSWRPELWRGPVPEVGVVAAESQTKLGEEATIFHDCRQSELTLRQLRNKRARDLAPFGLRMDVFRFDGSFLSIALDLPRQGVRDLRKKHLIRVNTIVETEKPIEIFARLNLRHGPNTEQIVRELPLAQEDVWVEFDLAYTNINEKRMERAWLDLIFEGPEMNMVTIRDVTFSRSPRADL
ncbi:MAG: DUF6478 family protein [Pseudomonadota bacterium]